MKAGASRAERNVYIKMQKTSYLEGALLLKTFWDMGANWTNLPEGIWQEQRQQSPICTFCAFQYVGSKYVREPLRAMLAAVTTPHQRRHAHYTPPRAAAHSPPPPPPAPPAPPPHLTPHNGAAEHTHTRPHDAYISYTRARVFIYQFSVVKMQHLSGVLRRQFDKQISAIKT